MTRLAVIVVNYNAGEMLRDCLLALVPQTLPSVRVLVLDNGSSGGSLEACRPLLQSVDFHAIGMYVRNMPGRLFWLYLPAHLAANLASVLLFIRKGQSRVILRAKWHALRGLPRTLSERWQIQRRRKITPSDLLRVLERGNLFVWAYRSARRVLGLR